MQLQSFQFCPVDYLSDSNVEAMTLEQQGAYIRLICHAWSSTTVGQLPNDDETLAQLSRLGEEKWAQSKSKILKAFDLSVDGFIVHRQLIAEYEKQKSFSEMQTEISNKRRKSANMRWECKTDANAMQMQCKTDAKPMQMQCKTDLERKEEEKEEKAPLVPPSLSHTLSLPPIIPPKEEKEEEKRDLQANACRGSEPPPESTETDLVEIYHRNCPSLGRVMKITQARSSVLKARLREHPALDFWEIFFSRVERSDFLCGRAPPRSGSEVSFKADLEWVTKQANFIKILEGRYDNRKKHDSNSLYERTSGLREFLRETNEGGVCEGSSNAYDLFSKFEHSGGESQGNV